MRWFRMYSEFATDPKVQSMSEPMQRRLLMLFCLHSEGLLEPFDDETFSCAMRISATELQRTKDLFDRKGFTEPGSWVPRNWSKRQTFSDHSNERVQRFRDKKKRDGNGDVTLQARYGNGEVTAPRTCATEAEAETEAETENPLPPSRSAEDQSEFNAALALLRGSMQTEGVAMELQRRGDLPGIMAIEGWRWLHAARVMGSGAKKKTVDYLIGIARNTTRQEFEAYGKPPSNGKPPPGKSREDALPTLTMDPQSPFANRERGF